jgi:PGF-CTERM protein
VTYTLVSRAGADAADFSIDEATGTVTLDSEAEFEDPGDADGNNEYELRVRATDAAGNSNTQNLTVVITEVTESSPDGTQTTDVASTPAGDSTPEATSAPATSVSDGTSTAPTATTPGSPTTTTGADGPGFGVVLTLTALLVAVGALARRSA